eukprot:596078-Prymnesium_polylepis.1
MAARARGVSPTPLALATAELRVVIKPYYVARRTSAARQATAFNARRTGSPGSRTSSRHRIERLTSGAATVHRPTTPPCANPRAREPKLISWGAQ